MTPSTMLLKKDSSSRRRWAEGSEKWAESWEVKGRRWESKSSLSICGVDVRLELRESIINPSHCHSASGKDDCRGVGVCLFLHIQPLRHISA